MKELSDCHFSLLSLWLEPEIDQPGVKVLPTNIELGPNVIKYFTSVIYEFSEEAKEFVSVRP
jgi:hypothetical protein